MSLRQRLRDLLHPDADRQARRDVLGPDEHWYAVSETCVAVVIRYVPATSEDEAIERAFPAGGSPPTTIAYEDTPLVFPEQPINNPEYPRATISWPGPGTRPVPGTPEPPR